MRKILLGFVSLLLAVMLVLSGCNLIGIDPIMQLDEDLAKKSKQYSGVVAKYDGGEITQADIMGELNSMYSYYSQIYSAYGIPMGNDALSTMEETVLEGAVENVAIAAEMEKRGLTLSEEQVTEAQQSAANTYQQYYDSFYSQATGENDEVRAKQTEYDLFTAGYTQAYFEKASIDSANRELIEAEVKGEITEVTDEELQTAFDERVAEDEETYSEDLGAFESAMTEEDTQVYWVPEGYRTVKHILIKPDADKLSAVTDARKALSDAEAALEDLYTELEDLNDADPEDSEAAEGAEADPETEPSEDTEADAEAEDADAEEAQADASDADESEDAEATDDETLVLRTEDEIQADIDAKLAEIETLKADVQTAESECLASVQDKLDEVNQKIEAGEDFNALIEAYGEDDGMKDEPTASRGYYVCADSQNWDANFTKGAMALEKVGDISEPVIGTSGIHIIRYESDVTPGAVSLEDVRDTFYDETLESMKEEHFDTALHEWVDALNAEYDLSAFNLGE